MRLRSSAIHEAGHAIIAMAYGFPVEEIYATDNDGYTKAAIPLLSKKLSVSDELRSYLFSHFKESVARGRFPDIDKETKELADEICNVVDFYLAGWLAEATLNPPQTLQVSQESYISGDVMLISRASQDILDICDMIGVSLKNSGVEVMSEIFLKTHVHSFLIFMDSESLRRDIRDIYFLDRFVYPNKLDEFTREMNGETRNIAQWLLLRQFLLFIKYFCHSVIRKQCVALAKRLTIKQKLSGSEAYDVIRNTGDPRAVKSLIRDLKNKDWRIREAAVWALRELGDAKATKPIIQHALKDKNSTVRWAAVWAFRELNYARTVEPLIQALKDEKSIVREAAATVLGDIKDTKAVEPLTQALKDKDISVRSRAESALYNIEAQDRHGISRRRQRRS